MNAHTPAWSHTCLVRSCCEQDYSAPSLNSSEFRFDRMLDQMSDKMLGRIVHRIFDGVFDALVDGIFYGMSQA